MPTQSPFSIAKRCLSSLGHIPPPLLPRSAAPLLCFTYRPPFDTPTTFPPPLIHFAHPIPVRRCLAMSSGLACIPPPLPPHSATPLVCFTHPHLFDAPSTPSDSFRPPHPRLTSLRRQTMLRQPGTHSSPPTDSIGCPSALFHPPAFIRRSNNLSTPSGSFCPPDPRSASPNDVQAAWDAFLLPYCLVRLPLSFVSPTGLHLTLQRPFHPL